MLGISAKFCVLYMFSGFLLYIHNLSRRQGRQAMFSTYVVKCWNPAKTPHYTLWIGNFFNNGLWLSGVRIGDFRGPIWMIQNHQGFFEQNSSIWHIVRRPCLMFATWKKSDFILTYLYSRNLPDFCFYYVHSKIQKYLLG